MRAVPHFVATGHDHGTGLVKMTQQTQLQPHAQPQTFTVSELTGNPRPPCDKLHRHQRPGRNFQLPSKPSPANLLHSQGRPRQVSRYLSLRSARRQVPPRIRLHFTIRQGASASRASAGDYRSTRENRLWWGCALAACLLQLKKRLEPKPVRRPRAKPCRFSQPHRIIHFTQGRRGPRRVALSSRAVFTNVL